MNNIELENWCEMIMPKLYGFFFRRCEVRSDVDDLVMKVFGEVIPKFKSSDIQSHNAYTWITAKHILYKYWLDKKKIISLDNIEDKSSYTPEYQGWKNDLLEKAKKLLSQHDWTLLYLYIGEETSSVELAKTFNTKPDTIRQRIHRIVKKIRNKIQF
jgi:RNA polymerase sigma factor (sigma-70 family)